MRQLVLAAGVACAAAGLTVTATGQTGPAGPNTMPGQVVGSGVAYQLNPVGSKVNKAAPPAGRPINLPTDNPLMRPYDPNHPYDAFKGTNISPDQLVAPIPGAGDQTALERWYDKLKGVVGYKRPTEVPHTTYIPSLTRRNRERADARLWRRD